MANIKQAFEYAAANPDSDFAKNLDQLAASGSLNQEAEKYGINLRAFQPKPAEPTMMESIKTKLSDIGNRQTESIQKSAELYKSGQQGALSTVGQTLGASVKAAGESFALPINEAVNKASSFVGEYAPENIKQAATELAQKGIELSKPSIEAYNTLPESERANIKAIGDLISGVTNLAVGAGAVKGIGNIAVKTAETLPKAGQAVVSGAKAVAESPIVSGTGEVLKSAGRTLKTIPENIATNVGEMQAKEAAIKAIPSVTGQNAVRKGLDLADATTLQKAIQTPEAKNLIQTIKDYAAGDKSVSPFEVVGKPIVNRLKTLDTQVKQYATQLDSVAQDLKDISLADVSKIDTAVMEGLKKLQIGVKKGGLDFVGSSLEGVGNSGTIVSNVYKRLQTAKDAFDLHNLKKYIDANVSYGKRLEGLDAGAERLLKTWRKSIDDTLDNQFEAYNKVNTELAKRISPLEDLKGILKNADGLDTDLLSEKAGIIARRITSAAASNPEIKQVLRNLDSFTSTGGKTLGKIENLQDLYNVLNKYYDIAPKTGFQNLVKEGTAEATGLYDEVASKIKGFAGATNATRQKALEDYLGELLTKPSKAKK